MKTIRLLILTLLTAGLFVLTGCTSSGESDVSAADSSAAASGSLESDAENVGQADGQQPDEGEDEEKEEKKNEKATSVQATKAFRGNLVLPVVAEGTIRARNSADIHAEIAGKVVRVYATEGQQITRGRMIAKLDSREYEAALEEARARYLQALSVLSIEGDIEVSEIAEEMRDEFSNLEKLEREGKITREERAAREIELDIGSIREGKFRYEVAAARSGVSEARASLERARINLERTEIRAPFAGVITGLTLSPGEQLIANTTICTLVDNVNLEAEVGVLEADLGHVVPGKPALLEVPALEQTIPVTVDVVSPQFDRETRTCQVLLRIKNENLRLRPGMFVRAQIAGRTFEDRLLVPREAILVRDGRPLLFKVDGDRASWLYVTLGEGNDYLVEIERVLQGGSLEPGDRVIVSDHLTLAHEAKVKVKKTLPVSDPWVALNTEDE